MTQSEEVRPIIGPIVDIPFLEMNLTRSPDPILQIYNSVEFSATRKFFESSPSARRSLLTDTAQALLYTIIRNLRPSNIVEIGTYMMGTSEGMARALCANGKGLLHTVSPFDAHNVHAILPFWPSELRPHVRYHQMDSMAFFMHLDDESIRPDLVLIDGNHDYEFASFDLQASARRIKTAGFIFMDNVSQAGPYLACRDFLQTNPEWTNCAAKRETAREIKAFDPDRTNIPMTDFYILRAPAFHPVGSRPVTLGAMPWSDEAVGGVRLSLATMAPTGTLHIQCILRGFSEFRLQETVGEAKVPISCGADQIDVSFQRPLRTAGQFNRHTVEIWLAWLGERSLNLSTPPRPY